MIRLPLIGAIAVFIVIVVMSIAGFVARSHLRPRLQGRQPCRKWFAVFISTTLSAVIFSCWVGTWGLGAASPGLEGSLFGLFAGTVWGLIFASINAYVLWQAFDPPHRDRDVERQEMMETDIGELASRIAKSVISFRPWPQFANTGLLSWSILVSVMGLTALWAILFCLLTLLTEGTPDVEPLMPIRR